VGIDLIDRDKAERVWQDIRDRWTAPLDPSKKPEFQFWHGTS
jgi:hypothetical protein